MREEMNILTNPRQHTHEPEGCRKLHSKNGVRSKKQELAVLMEIAAWREREARDKNVPRSRVLKDDAIAEIATQCPQTREALNQLRALPKGMATSRIGDAIQKAVAGRPRTRPQVPAPAR